MSERTRMLFFWLELATLFLLLLSSACKKQPRPVVEEPVAASDRVGASPQGTSQIALQKAFTVTRSAVFAFDIPAHAAMPHLRGNYKSFVTKLSVQSNEDGADVDFLVFTEDQYNNFLQSVAGDNLFSAPASHDSEVDVVLPPSLNEPRKFYLVFRNTPGGEAKKVVQADLKVDF